MTRAPSRPAVCSLSNPFSVGALAPLVALVTLAAAPAAGQQTDHLAPIPAALPRTHTPRPTDPAISAEDLKTRLYIFADDSMQGRAAGAIGNVKGTAYLAAEAERIGLQPVGDSGTFFQTVPVNRPYPMRNVVAVLPGSDPVLRHQYIVLGAHNDHLGISTPPVDHDSLRAYNHVMRPQGGASAMVEMFAGAKKPTADEWNQINVTLALLRGQEPARPDSIMNGADDDGSGSVALLEVAQALAAAKVRPKRSILFAWHTDEEGGMSGSKHLVSHPPVPLDSIVAELNVDMIGRGGASDHVGGGPQYLEVKKSGCLVPVFDTLFADANRRGGYGLQLTAARMADTVAGAVLTYSSDDDSYGSKGIPSAFLFTGVHPDYHQVTDEPQYVDYDHMARITNYLKDVTVQLADRAQPELCRSAP